MLQNAAFADLKTRVEIVKSLLECSSTDLISSDSGTEVHSDSSSVVIMKVKKLTKDFTALVKHSGSANAGRLLADAQNSCSVAFDKVAANLADKSDLIIKVGYNKECNAVKSVACDGSVELNSTPK
mmetsp:Transcript_42745/g.50089  ORF Transcript_42745/g.50089 Transcript_42745/m.50089 type:complete len:126 (-) Transcript_42745:1300-1677(-)